MSEKIQSLSSVCLTIDKSNPSKLAIQATGKVSSKDWTHPRLVKRVYVMRPADGIQDFDFRADAPGRHVPMDSSIRADGTLVIEEWHKGVRVASATGSTVALLSDPACFVPVGTAKH